LGQPIYPPGLSTAYYFLHKPADNGERYNADNVYLGNIRDNQSQISSSPSTPSSSSSSSSAFYAPGTNLYGLSSSIGGGSGTKFNKRRGAMDAVGGAARQGFDTGTASQSFAIGTASQVYGMGKAGGAARQGFDTGTASQSSAIGTVSQRKGNSRQGFDTGTASQSLAIGPSHQGIGSGGVYQSGQQIYNPYQEQMFPLGGSGTASHVWNNFANYNQMSVDNSSQSYDIGTSSQSLGTGPHRNQIPNSDIGTASQDIAKKSRPNKNKRKAIVASMNPQLWSVRVALQALLGAFTSSSSSSSSSSSASSSSSSSSTSSSSSSSSSSSLTSSA
jgi:hypothetical protein